VRIVIRSAEDVRGYFDGEGCVHYECKPKPWGRNGSFIIATSDLDVMADLVETMRAWDIAHTYHVYPPRGSGKRDIGYLRVKQRKGAEALLERIRPLSGKHEARLAPLLCHWAELDRRRAALAEGQRLVASGMSYREAAARTGLRFKQLAGRISSERRKARRQADVTES
jgi:intein/homing endonuclease